MSSIVSSQEIWPALSYAEFTSTAHLLHMGSQAIGKLKLNMPFEMHWANVALFLTSNGLTTGPLPYKTGLFSININLKNHLIECETSWGLEEKFALTSMSVATFVEKLFSTLKKLQIDLTINPMPQEIAKPIPFDQDTENRSYHPELAQSWWRILANSYRIMLDFHARFNGATPPIGFMWGTFDLRDARYNGVTVPTTGINAGYIRRNAMNEAQIEVGWWHGNDLYKRPAYYAFIYPKPDKIETARIKPKAAYWENNLEEFILDYDAIRQSATPEKDLLSFFESTYALTGWNKDLLNPGIQ